MKAFATLLDIVPGWIWAMVCSATFSWGGINAVRLVSVKSEFSDLKAAHGLALATAERKAAEKTAELQRTKDEAIAQAKTRAVENAADAGRARTELDRLRKQSNAGSRHANSTHAACTEYAAAATDVLNECGSALAEMAATADGHVNDIRTLAGSWPAWDKFASEMNDFTNRLKGTP